jgi:SAM-dependent methyltransferase
MTAQRSFAPLANPLVWELSRHALDRAFGLYRKRIDLLRAWMGADASVLDVGCGVGSYSAAATGPYLGVDLDAPYIRHAQQRRGDDRRTFLCGDVAELSVDGEYDVVLAVDLLHHLTDDEASSLLRISGRLAREQVVLFEPVLEQTEWLGRWFIDHDRGEHMRPRAELLALVERSLTIERQEALRLGPIETVALQCAPTRGRA